MRCILLTLTHHFANLRINEPASGRSGRLDASSWVSVRSMQACVSEALHLQVCNGSWTIRSINMHLLVKMPGPMRTAHADLAGVDRAIGLCKDAKVLTSPDALWASGFRNKEGKYWQHKKTTWSGTSCCNSNCSDFAYTAECMRP